MENLLEHLFSLFAQNNVVTAIHYGNRGGRDDDVFVVIHGSHCFFSASHEQLDITAVGEAWMPMMVSCLDPIVTEPLLEGRVIFGQPAGALHDRLAQTRAHEESDNYLLFHARLFLEWARARADAGQFGDALQNVGFAAGFATFAAYYREHPQPVSLRLMLRQWKHPTLALLAQIRDITKKPCPNLGIMYDAYAHEVAAHLTHIENEVCLQ